MKRIESVRNIWKQFNVILTPGQKKWSILVFVMSLVGAVVETLGVSAILPLVQVLLEPEQLMKIAIIKKICFKLDILTEKELFILVTIGVVAVYFLKNGYMCVLSYVRATYATKVQRELSVRMLKSYMERGYIFFRNTNTANLLRGIGGLVGGIYNILYNFMRIMAEVLTILCIVGFVIYTDWKLAISVVALVGVSLCLVLYVFKGIVQRAGNKFYMYMELVSKWALQLFSGIREVLVLDRKDFFIYNYEESYKGQQENQVKQTVATETPAYIIEGICVAGIILSVCIRVIGMDNPVSYVPQLAAFAVAAFRLLPSIGRISSFLNTCIFNLSVVPEVYNNIKEANRYENIKKDSKEKFEIQDITFNRCMVVKNVSWKYPDGENSILENITLTIKKGESIAFVGPSGAGKSTLADIILGLFQPQNGEVLMDDVNILNNRKAVSNIISFVSQDVYLIDDTIRRNVAFGIFDKDINEEMVWKALEQSQMKEYVESLPYKLDTLVGERGTRFSGGQAQRLAIARALYTNPDILVLDEATSALDTETEMAVMEAIESLQGEKTLIIIAHRLSTIKKCDKIYEIANGKAIERKYEDLI